MKAFFKSLMRRIGDLIIKNLSMKVETAAIVTWVYVITPNKGAYEFTLIVIVWLSVVGIRYAEKVKGLLPTYKG